MKKKQYYPRILALLLAVIMVFGLMPTAFALSDTIFVDAENGDDSGGGAAYQTLQAAYEAVSDGGTISLQSEIELDTRYLDFNMNKSVTIEGNGHVIEYTCADHIGTEQNGVITCSQGNLTLNNLVVKMPDQRGTNGRILYVGPAASVGASNVSFLNGYSAYVGGGVYVDGGTFTATDTTISNCYVANTMEAYGGGLYANGGSVSFSGK